jgi:hypothetical protein
MTKRQRGLHHIAARAEAEEFNLITKERKRGPSRGSTINGAAAFGRPYSHLRAASNLAASAA